MFEYVPPRGTGVEAEGYLVLEYVEGQTLENLLRQGRVPDSRLIAIIASVADAVHHVHTHASGIVHRDLKPSNILIDLEDVPHVCDFGLAIDEDVQRQRQIEVAGTLPYMAPEQVRGETHRFDGRTDIWAIGVILYRGLTGKLPFPGRDQDEIFDEILHRDPKPLRMHDPGIEPELERICLRCLSRPMAERYLTAADLAADLKGAIQEPPSPQKGMADLIAPKGLRPYDDGDSDFFLALLPGPRRGDGLPESVRFWKDRVEAVERERAFSVGVLYGPTGGGKSSFVRAGLFPTLDRGLVRPIYLEATPAGTESRLLAELRHDEPTLSSDADLSGAIAALRDVRMCQPPKKRLLVIDQFEQWLQAHAGEPDAELVRALRQCDGRRVQALVVVRDDFWMAVTRFLRAVDVPLVQGANAAALELFDVRHARTVLERFGRALGRIPEEGAAGAGEAALFLDEAASGLAGPDDTVIPARLSLFTVVVRHRAWTSATLRALGGVEGIGVKFLDDCFASAPYKGLRGAAQKVLKKLLPPPTSVIRGAPRTASELRAAAGLADQPAGFDELVRVLDGELRLISAVGALERPRPVDEDAPIRPDEACYQIAHDYLVRPIRQWLDRDRGSTRKGRARLRLELITASWLEHRRPRQLPSTIELATILWHVPANEWSSDERRLIRAAQRHLLGAVAVCAGLVAVMTIGVKSLRDRGVAARLLETSLHADYRNLPRLIPELERYSAFLVPGLLPHEQQGAQFGLASTGAKSPDFDAEHLREVAGILLFRFAPTPERGTYLRSILLAAREPEKVSLIQDALAKHPETAGVELLRAVLLDGSAEPSARLRVACVLAKVDPDGAKDRQKAAAALTLALMGEDRRTITRWVELLGPAVRELVSEMAKECQSRTADPLARTQIAAVLAEALTRDRDAERLGDVLVDSQPDAARILRSALAVLDRREAAIGGLRGILNERPADDDFEDRKDSVASRRAEAALTLAVLGDTEPLWPLLGHQPDPRLRARLIDTLADSGLAPQVLLDGLNRPGLDTAQRQAILLALAEARQSASTYQTHAGFLETAATWFLQDPDPGVHSAALLLLRRWKREDLAERRPAEPVPATGVLATRVERRWENGPNGHTFAILPGPLEFWMGSPKSETGRAGSEERHYRRINRSIAVATMEVTADQFRAAKLAPEYHPEGANAQTAGVVANAINWYNAAGYCNWLSRQAGILPEDWCYPDPVNPGCKIEATGIEKKGYRLPTEAEWEYFCRAGTETSRSFGGTEVLLPRYACTALSSRNQTNPPGGLLPNEFGLFDTLGNVLEWCHDGLEQAPQFTRRYQDAYPSGTLKKPAADVIRDVPVLKDDICWFYLRGASFESSPDKARSAFRDEGPVEMPLARWGFRVVRTVRSEGR